MLLARPSFTFTLKNLAILLMCAVFLCLFAYDGYVGYPRKDDELVKVMRSMIDQDKLDVRFRVELDAWPGWDNASEATRERMDHIARQEAKIEGWKGPLDIEIQKWVLLLLIVATAWSLWRFIRFRRRRVIADDATVSPAAGVVIPWDKITRVDNSLWKSKGIVQITYTDATGATKIDKFDDYETDREPLLKILDQLSEKAVNAEFVPKEDPTEPATDTTQAKQPPTDGK